MRGTGARVEAARAARNAAIVADAATMTKRQLEAKYGMCFTGIALILKQAGVEAVYDRRHAGKNIIYNWKAMVRLGNETHLECRKCGVEKPIADFYLRGWTCRKCTSEKAAAWNREHPDCRKIIRDRNQDKNRDARNAGARAHYYRTIDRQKKRAKEYHVKNRSAITKKAIAYIKARKKRDPKFRALITCKRRMWILFKSVGLKKKLRSAELLGIDRAGFFAHIESLFQPGMTWANRGKYGWHIDHIKPCALFDMTDLAQAKECWHYTNLQPLWAADNWSKGKKFDQLLIDSKKDQSVCESATGA